MIKLDMHRLDCSKSLTKNPLFESLHNLLEIRSWTVFPLFSNTNLEPFSVKAPHVFLLAASLEVFSSAPPAVHVKTLNSSQRKALWSNMSSFRRICRKASWESNCLFLAVRHNFFFKCSKSVQIKWSLLPTSSRWFPSPLDKSPPHSMQSRGSAKSHKTCVLSSWDKKSTFQVFPSPSHKFAQYHHKMPCCC